MAALSFDTASIADLLIQNYGQLIVDNVVKQGPGNRMSPGDSVHGRLREKGRVFLDGSDENDRYAREWAIHSAGATANSFDAATPFPVALQETYDEARLAWKRIGISLEYDNLATLGRGVTRRGMNLIVQDFEQKCKEMISELAIQLVGDGTGNGGRDVDGVGAFMKASGTYANIAQTSSYWQPVLNAVGGAALALSHFETILQTMHNARGGISGAHEIWMNSVQWNNYRSLFTGQIRYAPGDGTSEALRPVYADGQHELPIYIIRDIPTDEVWVIDTDSLELRFKTNTPAAELADMKDGDFSKEGVPFMLQTVSKDLDVKSLFLKMYPQLICTNPFKQAAITGLSTA